MKKKDYRMTMADASEHECEECGKQLWKRVFVFEDVSFNEFGDGDSEPEFCSKKCGMKWLNKTTKMEAYGL